MNDNMNASYGYFAKDTAAAIEITTSTLRRWSIALEKGGYEFERNDREQRIYYERDFKAFRELKKLLSKSIAFEDAINTVVSMNLSNKNAQKTPSVQTDIINQEQPFDSTLSAYIQAEIQKGINQHKEQLREELLSEVEEKVLNLIEVRDRQITIAMKEALEHKHLEIAATTEIKIPWYKRLKNIFK